MELKEKKFMNRMKAARSALFAVAFSFSLTALFVIPAVYVYRNLELNLGTKINEHQVNLEASVKLLNRDVEDLEDQLRVGLKRSDTLIGSFEIYPGPHGLTATHTSAPKSPIEIVADSRNAFSDSLQPALGADTYIFTNDGVLVSKIRQNSINNSVAFNVSDFVKSFSTKTKKNAGFAKMGLGGVLRLPAQPSVWSLLRARDNYRYSAAAIKNTNLVLISLKNISLNRREVALAFLPFAAALLAFAAASALAYRFWRQRRKSALNWLQQNLKGFRYGRFDLGVAPKGLTGWDRELISSLKEQFGTQSPFSPFYTGKWLDESRRIATWQAFRNTISLWSTHKKAGNDVVLGDHWVIGRLKASRTQTLDSAIRIFGRAFSDRAIIFNHYAENEVVFATRTQHFEEWFDRTQKSLRAWVDYENLRANDFVFAGCLFSDERRYTVDQVFEKFESISTKSLRASGDVMLQDAIAHFWDHADETGAVLKFSWLQLMILPADHVRYLTQFDRMVATMPLPGTRNFPTPQFANAHFANPQNTNPQLRRETRAPRSRF